jgi:hypothetical protein
MVTVERPGKQFKKKDDGKIEETGNFSSISPYK